MPAVKRNHHRQLLRGAGMNLVKNSVISPLSLALNNTPYYAALNSILPSLEALSGRRVGSHMLDQCEINTIARILCLYNMRASEALSINIKNHIGAGRVVVKGLKGSGDYIVWIPYLHDIIDSHKLNGQDIAITNSTYRQLYDYLKQKGFDQNVGNKNTKACTHSSRYSTAGLVSQFVGRDSVTDILRHRSKRTKSYYLKEKGCQNG